MAGTAGRRRDGQRVDIREGAMVKRAVCVLLGHNWTRHRYESSGSDDQPAGHFLKCARCGRKDEGTSFPPGTLAGGF
jgi:hypothetical protein